MSKAAKRERQKENRERAREERERMMKRQRQMKALRSLAFILVPIMVILIVVSLVNGGDSSSSSASKACGTPVKNPVRTFTAAPPETIDAAADYRATICTSMGDITLSLDAKNAPVATNNFVFLARQGFYDGLTFHRAAKDFVIQGGDPKGDGSGGPGYNVTGEVSKNNYPEGVLAAAKGGTDPAGTFGSQFFIVTGKNGATLPNDYTRFGRVNQGIAIAKKIEALAPSSGDGPPTKKVTILAIQVRENGKVLSPTTSSSSTTTTTAPATSSTTAAATSSTT